MARPEELGAAMRAAIDRLTLARIELEDAQAAVVMLMDEEGWQFTARRPRGFVSTYLATVGLGAVALAVCIGIIIITVSFVSAHKGGC